MSQHTAKIVLIVFAITITTLLPSAFAEENRPVVIVEGNIDPKCIESACYDPNPISINTGDTVIWVNEDIPAHTIVSGTPLSGQDGLFDSGLILPDKTFERTFTAEGTYPYYCILHPWATGTVLVTGAPVVAVEQEKQDAELEITTEDRDLKRLAYIGSEVGDGRSYMMSYISDGKVASAQVFPESDYIDFKFSEPAPHGDEITMKLHKEMIENPSFILVNDIELLQYSLQKQNDGNYNTLTFTAPEETWSVKIYGTRVVPEFGQIVVPILIITITAMVLLTRKQNFSV